MINQAVVFGQFKGGVLPANGLINTAWLAVSDFIVDMFHAENIANWGYRWQPSTSNHQFGIVDSAGVVPGHVGNMTHGDTGGHRCRLAWEMI